MIFRRLSGLAEGVSSIIHCAGRQEWSSLVSCTGLAQFEPRYTVFLCKAKTSLILKRIALFYCFLLTILMFLYILNSCNYF